jgi:hypothetical protein
MYYYDKTAPRLDDKGKPITNAAGDPVLGENVPIKDGFTFLLLDELATIGGFHDASQSSIYSNEVRDTRREPFVVKCFGAKGTKQSTVLAEGFYAAIKDRIKASGGKFCTNLYIAFRNGKNEPLQIGGFKVKGAALSVWMDFRQKQQSVTVERDGKQVSVLYVKAIKVMPGYDEHKKGKTVYRQPKGFVVMDTTPQTDAEALELDKRLQAYLTAYLAKNTAKQVDDHAQPDPQAGSEVQPDAPEAPAEPAVDDDVPF